MPRKNLDSIDRKILRILQADATLSLDRIAEVANLSATACWRRIRRMEEDGVIEARVTLLSQRALGLALTGYVMIRTDNHSDEWLERFAALIQSMEEIVEFHRMTGDVDYLLKIVAPDLESYDQLYRKFIRIPGIRDVSASFSMERIKGTTALPLVFS
ncbi:MAG: Lrp/AsnC family transcriptional regulator [Candidatus Andeanibacterium colombiense]|uniref:Lrp/AsnC family transcriptional regulator n=1 Tax=Candidatus Andeanibacterium colombiense TaxID=3121345 RepID=A0AAJ5X3G7_9SPHN|nr:MAG: Lrp/AsnC family transcriptional regulator [Sphingomonadaceae bacterium]